MSDKVIEVVIADDNAEFASLLQTQINKESDFNVTGIAYDGLQTIQMIETKKPDMVILDLIMPNLDGLGVLERIKDSRLDKKPVFIVLSAMCQDTFVKRALTMGAQYYIVKPFNIMVLISRMRQIMEEEDNVNNVKAKKTMSSIKLHNLENEVTDLLHNTGVPTHLAGFRYLRDAIVFCTLDKKLLKSVTTDLCEMIGEKHNVDKQKIERSMRNALDQAYKREGQEQKRMTNAEFIAETVKNIEKNKTL